MDKSYYTDEIENCTAALYEEGWRSNDRDEMKEEYNLNNEWADAICKKLKEYERMVQPMKGYNESTGLFKSRYYAKKYAKGDEVAVKVEGGYTIMTDDYYYRIWKTQK